MLRALFILSLSLTLVCYSDGQTTAAPACFIGSIGWYLSFVNNDGLLGERVISPWRFGTGLQGVCSTTNAWWWGYPDFPSSTPIGTLYSPYNFMPPNSPYAPQQPLQTVLTCYTDLFNLLAPNVVPVIILADGQGSNGYITNPDASPVGDTLLSHLSHQNPNPNIHFAPSAVVGVNETVYYSMNPANPGNAVAYYTIKMNYKVAGSPLSGAYPIQLQGVCSGTVVINFATCASDPTCVSKLNGPPPGTASPATMPPTNTSSAPPTVQPTTGGSSNGGGATSALVGSSGLSETVVVLLIVVVALFGLGMIWLCRNRIAKVADKSADDDVSEEAPLNTFD